MYQLYLRVILRTLTCDPKKIQQHRVPGTVIFVQTSSLQVDPRVSIMYVIKNSNIACQAKILRTPGSNTIITLCSSK